MFVKSPCEELAWIQVRLKTSFSKLIEAISFLSTAGARRDFTGTMDDSTARCINVLSVTPIDRVRRGRAVSLASDCKEPSMSF